MLNGEEVIPEGYHGKLLMSGLGVAPDDRYLTLDLDPGNKVLKVVYIDFDNPLVTFANYNVSVYIEMELAEDAQG